MEYLLSWPVYTDFNNYNIIIYIIYYNYIMLLYNYIYNFSNYNFIKISYKIILNKITFMWFFC